MQVPRQNTCPECGYYIWAHPIKLSENSPVETDICSLGTGQAEEMYKVRLREFCSRKTEG